MKKAAESREPLADGRKAADCRWPMAVSKKEYSY